MALYDMLGESKVKEMSAFVHRKWEEAKKSSLRTQVLQDAKDSRAAYDQIPASEELWDDAINLVLPFHTISLDQLEPRLTASIVGHDTVVSVEDFGQLDEEMRLAVGKMDNVVLKDDVKIVEEVKKHVHDVLLDGHIFVAPYWDYREGKVREYVTDEMGMPMRAEGLMEIPPGMTVYAGKLMQERVDATNDRVRVDMLESSKVFVPDRVDDWEDTPVVYEYFMSWGDYLGKVKTGKKGWVEHTGASLEELGEQIWTKRPDDEDKEDGEKGEHPEVGEKGVPAERLKAELRCLQMHFSYDVDDDGVEEKIICTIEESTKKVLYVMDNVELDPLNRKQIQVIRLMPRAGTAYGHSLYTKLRMIQEGGSDALNITLNSCIIQMMPFFFYEEAAGFENAEFELFPGAGIKVADVNRVKMNSFQPNAAAFKDIIEIFFRLWQYIVTLPDYNVGKEPASEGSTATGVMALLQEASIAHDYLGATLHDQYTKIFRIIHDLCYLNMSEEREIETLGHPLPKVLSDGYKVRLVSSTKSANKYMERAEKMEALTIAKEGIQMGVIVPDEPIRDYLELHEGVNVDKWMNGPVSQVCARMRASMGMEGTKTAGEDVDPFGELVMQLQQMPPEAIGQLMQTMQVGKVVRDEATEAFGMEEEGMM